MLLGDLNELLTGLVMAAKMRRLRVWASRLGYCGGVYGAGIVAGDELRQCHH